MSLKKIDIYIRGNKFYLVEVVIIFDNGGRYGWKKNGQFCVENDFLEIREKFFKIFVWNFLDYFYVRFFF